MQRYFYYICLYVFMILTNKVINLQEKVNEVNWRKITVLSIVV